MIADALALYDFIQKNAKKITTLGAIFDEDGAHIEGNKKIKVERISTDIEYIWFYKVRPLEDYVFVPIPVQPCRIEYGLHGQNLTTDIFRFTFNNLSATTRPNLLVGFSIIGYKPKQLLNRLKPK